MYKLTYVQAGDDMNKPTMRCSSNNMDRTTHWTERQHLQCDVYRTTTVQNENMYKTTIRTYRQYKRVLPSPPFLKVNT